MRRGLPRSYLLWLAGTRASLLGDVALHFALGWAAGAHGGSLAGLVLAAVTVPRTLLLLPGGAIGDRFGARRMMIAGDLVMLVAVLGLAAAGTAVGAAPWLLVGFAVVVGTVDAFYLPATGAMPRHLVDADRLPRATALQQAGGQVAALLGAPLGAVLVAGVGLSGTALVDAVTFAAVLAVMVRLRPPHGRGPGAERTDTEHAEKERAGRRTESLRAGIADGVRLAAQDPVLRPALLLTAAAAAGLLPVVALLGPLLARAQGWGAGAAGLVAAAHGGGVLVVALVAARRGVLRRIGVGASLGLGVAAAGVAGLAAAPGPAAAACAAGFAGAGSGLFACHIGPLVLAGAPRTHLARVQAVLTLVQSAALVPANGGLGWLAGVAGPRRAIALCAAVGLAAALAGLATRALRTLNGPVGR